MNKINQSLLEEYLAARQMAWAPVTHRNTRYALLAMLPHLDGPAALWKFLQSRKPYARVTMWTQAMSFIQWAIDRRKMEGPNEFKIFREENARLFRNTYQPKKPEISYEEAVERINRIADGAIRRRALEIIGSGVRYSESAAIDSHGTVRGKGGKERRVYQPSVDGPNYQGSYQTFRKGLAAVGLKPHDLRKIALSRLVELGADPFDLCQVAGWSSIETAQSYIRVNSGKIEQLMHRLQNGANGS